MSNMLLSVLKHFEQENIQYCLIRDGDCPEQIASKGEADLLIQNNQLQQVQEMLAQLGFVSLPNWGYAPHYFFVIYDHVTGTWLKLDVVTEIVYGRPIRTLRTGLARSCLETRQRAENVFVPASECELVMLLLHCLLDKGKFTSAHIQRLQALHAQVTDVSYIETLLARYWLSGMSWLQLAAYIDTGQWEKLLTMQKAVARRLTRGRYPMVWERKLRKRILRKINRWMFAARPPALTVALLAPDGAGKSTVTSTIEHSFYFPVHTIYMGLYQKGRGKGLNVPLPGVGILIKLVTQWWRYAVGRYHQARRRLVLFDRYTYDALSPSERSLNWLKRGRRWLLAYSCPAPDLIIVLDAPGQVLYERKGEHDAALLEKQRQHYLSLRDHLPQLMVVDATQDAEQVCRTVTALIWKSYVDRQTGSKISQRVTPLGIDRVAG